jgi:predicted Zn-dependent peptidase
MRRWPSALVILVLIFFARGALAIDPHETTLDNGLQVVVDGNIAFPQVTVALVYRVGSSRDPENRRGLAELTMWLMANRTEHVAEGRLTAELDALATTWRYTSNADTTTFIATVAPGALERVLWMFSDEMGFFEKAIDDHAIRDRLATMQNERVHVEDSMFALATEVSRAALFPEGHPYHRVTVSRAPELRDVKPAEVAAFHRQWFTPRNATLVIDGAVEPEHALELARKYFASIPGGALAAPIAIPEPALSGQTWIEIGAPVQSATLMMEWPTPAHYANGDADLDAVAGILDGSRSARLRWDLDAKRHLVTNISAHQRSSSHGSRFVISATLQNGHTPREVATAIDEVLRGLRTTPPDGDDLAGAIIPVVRGRLGSFERSYTRALLLAGWQIEAGRVDYAQEDIMRYGKITVATFNAALAWLPLDRRVVTVIVPDTAAPPGGALHGRTFTAASAP